MREPEVPATEERRLAALYSLGMLDTPGEEVFDSATRLAVGSSTSRSRS